MKQSLKFTGLLLSLLVPTAALALPVTIENHGFLNYCVAYEQVAPGTDPDLGIYEASGWTCQRPNSLLVLGDVGDRATFVILLESGASLINYADVHPGGMSTAVMPVPSDIHLSEGFSIRYAPTGDGRWTYDYTIAGTRHTAVSNPDPSWVPGLSAIGFQTQKGFDLLTTVGETKITIEPVDVH